MASTKQSAFRFEVTRGAVLLNNEPLAGAGPPTAFYEIFGVPDRVADSPAPVGHRSPQFHYYELLGMMLYEHHYTHQVSSISLVFDTDMANHPTRNVFSGELLIGSVAITAGSLERALADTGFAFNTPLRSSGWWSVKVGEFSTTPVSIGVSTKGPKLLSGRRSKSKVIASVSFSLKHDPWDASHRPHR